ncbi:MAG: PAS domain S-box protein [Desulfofustis sp.]|nr:PAS domain S-box protein [Desulfofustis sp.]
MILDLIKNIALLVTLAVGLRFLGYRFEQRRSVFLVMAGGLFGLVGVVGMMTPLQFAPGIIYDGRSIVLSLAGLFGGPVVAAIAVPICATYRFYLGGPGAIVGIAVILEAAALGVVLYYLRQRDERWVGPLALLLFGVVVHAVMLGLQLMIPGVGLEIVRRIGPSVILFFPLAFLLIAQIFLEVERRRQAERRLRGSEAYYRSLFENNQVPMLIIAPERGTIVDANPAAVRFYGWPREQLCGMAVSDINPLSEEQIRADIDAARPDRGHHWPVQHRLADGSVRDVEIYSGSIWVDGRDLLYVLVYDISERVRAEEQVRQSEAYQRALINASPLAVIGISPEGTVLSWNSAAEALFGWREEEVVGRLLPFAGDGQKDEFADLRRRVLAGETISRREVTRRRKDGSPVEVSLSAAPVVGADGSIVSIVGLVEDISQRKQAERDHEMLERQLLQARKMEAIGQLAGGVAHDFNNLLQIIIGHGEILAEKMRPDTGSHHELVQMMNASERAAKLVRQLLAFSRRQVLDMRDLDLNLVLDNCLSMLRRLLGGHISLSIINGHRLATVRADVNQLEQIVVNLCINARDAMPEGGLITIETENVRIDESFRVNHPWARPGRYVLLSVTDTGCGMDEDTRSRVFEPFFTTKAMGHGTGLGLATVYGLVKQHEGMIHVYSEVGKGTTFKVYLPAVERAALQVGDKIEGAVVGGGETILVAEDEEMVLKLTATILEGAGYRVLVGHDGEEAVQQFKTHADEIDMVLLDVVMPKLGGFSAYEQIKEIRPKVRAIFTSGYSVNAIHADYVLYDGLHLLQKPCGRDDLLRKVRSVLDQS